MDPIYALLKIVSVVGIGVYYVAIVYIGWPGVREPPPPEILTYFVTFVGGTLATFFGAVLGAYKTVPAATRNATTARPYNKVQVFAAWAYIGSLGLAAIMWTLGGFKASPALIQHLTVELVGVVAGALGVLLGIQPPAPPSPTAGGT